MIFLSAQPDDPYFIWQLEVQLHNFGSFGIQAEDIYILVGYDPVKGIHASFQDFSLTNAYLARIFFYPAIRDRMKAKIIVYVDTFEWEQRKNQLELGD